MDDLISRDLAVKAMMALEAEDIADYGCDIPEGFDGKRASDALMKIPSAERTGRWTHVYDENEKLFFRNKWVCSACGKANYYGMSDFCPCCGAMMENSTRRMKEAEDGE